MMIAQLATPFRSLRMNGRVTQPLTRSFGHHFPGKIAGREGRQSPVIGGEFEREATNLYGSFTLLT
jgi:hypothetical protein